MSTTAMPAGELRRRRPRCALYFTITFSCDWDALTNTLLAAHTTSRRDLALMTFLSRIDKYIGTTNDINNFIADKYNLHQSSSRLFSALELY